MRYTRRITFSVIVLAALVVALNLLWQHATSQDGQPAVPVAGLDASTGGPGGALGASGPAGVPGSGSAGVAAPASNRRPGALPQVLPVRRTSPPSDPAVVAQSGLGGTPAVLPLPPSGERAGAAPAAAQDASRPVASPHDPGWIENCQLTLIDEADIPAQEAGVLKSLTARVKDPATGQLRDVEVKEGLEVAEGDQLGQIDDLHAQRALEIAQAKLRAANREAGNDVNVRYAQAKAEVAYAEIEQAEATNAKAPGTVTPFELRRLKLAYNESYLAIEQATHELAIAGEKENVSKAELAAAVEDVRRRKIIAPWSGMIVQRYRRVGEWVKPGDPVFQLVRLDRLRIQAFLDAERIAPAEVDGQPVTVTVTLPHQVKRTFQGRIVFVSPRIENDGRFLVHAEVVNEQDASGHWQLRPGQKGSMRIELRRGG